MSDILAKTVDVSGNMADTVAKTADIYLFIYLPGCTMLPSSCAHFTIMLSSSSNCFYLSNPLPVTPFLPSFL
jgi:hypothetical protein